MTLKATRLKRPILERPGALISAGTLTARIARKRYRSSLRPAGNAGYTLTGGRDAGTLNINYCKCTKGAIMEKKLFAKFEKMYPDIINHKTDYLKLESTGFEPLSIERLYGNRISVMHTYEMNGDLCYDPMMEFILNPEEKTMTAVCFEMSIPPVYEYIDDSGTGKMVSCKGEERTAPGLQEELNDFAYEWLKHIAEQEYEPITTHYREE